ncbi:aspartyl protease family protein [Ekhidna sp. To15]|uniref:aspartyl protease family protein n=1 Tax=Ekhidna sp. To15 TaxID=3395267 RepID=UPI003F51F7E3
MKTNSNKPIRLFKNGLFVLLLFIYGVGCKPVIQEQLPLPEGAIPIVYRSHIYISGSADGVKGNFVFDTGADNLYYDTSFFSAHDFHYENLIETTLGGAGNSSQNVIVIMDTVSFAIGEDIYRTSIVPVLRLKPILGDFPEGIIGLDYFSDGVLEINYIKQYIKYYDSIQQIDITDYTKIELERANNRLYIPIQVWINDSIQVQGKSILDLGSGSSLSLSSSVAEKYQLSKNITKKVGYFNQYYGVGGASSSYDFRANAIQISNFTLKNVSMNYSLDTLGAMASDDRLGLLGNKILERFDIFLDFSKNELYLKPNSNFNAPFNFSRLGFSYIDRSETLDSWIVTGLYRSTNATASGLSIDDHIKSVNGIAVGEIQYENQKSFFEKNSEIKLEIDRNGKTINVTIQLKEIL